MSGMTVACQGTYGANSQTACKAAFGEDADIMFMRSFDAVFTSVENGLCDYGVLPIENSTNGSVSAVYDLLRRHEVSIIKAVRIPIRHCLAGIEGAAAADVKKVLSHEQALGQCRAFLKKNKLEQEGYPNTATAARYVSQQGDKEIAAICSEDCAKEYGLKIFKRDIQDSDRNYTRFICIKNTAKDDNLSGGKISIICSLENKCGSLYSLLGLLAENGADLTKIESRPIPDTDFEFMFYIDFVGDFEKMRKNGLFEKLKSQLAYYRLLGCYDEYAV